MADHDPYCGDCDPYDRYCHCALIARVHADERAKVYRPDAHQMMLERDAARAEVAALRERLAVEQSRTTFARIAVREVLADLRAKVEGLEHDATCSFIPQDGPCDCVRGAVLALLDEEEVPHG